MPPFALTQTKNGRTHILPNFYRLSKVGDLSTEETLTNMADPANLGASYWQILVNIIRRQLETMAGTERQRELRRRRNRSKKLTLLQKKAEKSSKAEKAVIAHKLRRLSPGAEQLIKAWKLV